LYADSYAIDDIGDIPGPQQPSNIDESKTFIAPSLVELYKPFEEVLGISLLDCIKKFIT
jgi:hypothetical protein